MLCLSYHNPANLALVLDKGEYEVVSVFSKDELKNIKILGNKETEKQKVLFIRGISHLLKYAEKKPKTIKKFKIVVFDTPKNFFRHSLEMQDAVHRPNGIWSVHPMYDSLPTILKKLKQGIIKGDKV